MMKSKLMAVLLATILIFGAVAMVNAASFSFDGNITYHNDVIEIGFTLDTDATDVNVWTDSFMSPDNSAPGVNFDPITAVWKLNGADYTLIDENDDNSSIDPDQTYYDSGLEFSSLVAGEYLFTIATFANFANGSLLSSGFAYDSETPILLSAWTQPANEFDMGSYYRVNLAGVDSAVNNTATVVPEPSTVLLLGSGLVGFALYGRKRKKG